VFFSPRKRNATSRISIASSLAETAERILTEIESACAELEEFPARGNIPKELAGIGISEYRELHQKPWRLIYRIMGTDVVGYCVVGGRRDMQSFLERKLIL
jgi:toxin ParE1/3/4